MDLFIHSIYLNYLMPLYMIYMRIKISLIYILKMFETEHKITLYSVLNYLN